MQLEDHVGDIIRKARSCARQSASAAASAVAVSEAVYARFESSGQGMTAEQLMVLSKLTDLDAAKLLRIAAGWLPRRHATTNWGTLRMITSNEDDFAVNAFLIWDQESRQAALFDTGFTIEPIQTTLEEHRLHLSLIAITHGHSDHVAKLDELMRLHPDAEVVGAQRWSPDSILATGGERFRLGQLSIAVVNTPGHAGDGLSFVVTGWPDGQPAVAIIGDTLFAGSMGKAESSWPLTKERIRSGILSLPDETLLCPGHGPLTTVGEERANNPFF